MSTLRCPSRISAGILVLLLGFPDSGHATLEESLPSYHWSYDILDQLRLRGYFTELFMSNRPFTRGAVAKSIQQVAREIDRAQIGVTQSDQWLIDQLRNEFDEELLELRGLAGNNRIKLGFTGNLDAMNQSKGLEDPRLIHYGVLNGGSRLREGLRSKISAGIGDNLTLYHTLRFDRNMKDDPTYVGKFFMGFAGFTEQAYLQGRTGRFQYKVGRDFIAIGPGKSGNLLISDNARPFDQYRIDFVAGPIRFSAFGIQLDDVALDSVIVRGQGPMNTARRFINGHRMDVKFGSWANVGFSEIVIYGGVQRSFELAYVNPVNFYHGVTLNDEEALGRPANTFGSLDVDLFPSKNLEIFAEFLVDDVKIERANSSDLEPNRLAYMLGIQYANPFRIDGVRIRADYTHVANRTYNVLFNPWEKHLHRNRPIGHFLGNNFDRFQIEASGWMTRDLQVSTRYERLRQGEDNIASAYNTDYLSATVSQGYSENFPFGTIQTSDVLNLSASFVKSIDLRFRFDLRVAHVQNMAFGGRSGNQLQMIRVGLMYNYDRLLGW
ncbi:MAG: hypothetical protein HOH43_10810 [Candidatus Latescibacteria bacterium]|nr:hypothetical protein [Candidatus Latescibacterota bacterium]